MSYKWIVTILALILFFVLSKTELRYYFGNHPNVSAYIFLPYQARAALSDLPDRRLSRLYVYSLGSDHAFI